MAISPATLPACEEWDIYDRDRRLTGRKMARGSAFEPGAYHLVVHVCLFNARHEMLIQQRQPFKDGWPNMWDVPVGGSALAGETSQAAATRELQEELGYRIDLEGQRPRFTLNFEVGFDDFYLIEAEPAMNELRLQPEEVQAVRWASQEEILRMIDQGEFIAYHKSLVNLLFTLSSTPSAHFRPNS